MIRNTAGIAAGIWVIATVAAVFLLRAASQLLIPIVIAVLISYALEPIVAWMHRRHLPRALGASVLLASILALTGWGVYSLRDDAVEAIDALPEAARRARELVWSQGESSAAQKYSRPPRSCSVRRHLKPTSLPLQQTFSISRARRVR